MSVRSEERQRGRFYGDRPAFPRPNILNLEDDDDDDDDDNYTTEPMLLTRFRTTPELGMEFVTIPGKDARPLATVGPITGVILFLGLIALLSLAVYRRRRRPRRVIERDLDKVPLSSTSATVEGYCPYKIESDSGPVSASYAKLDQPSTRRFPNVRFSHQTRPSGRVRSLGEYDEPRPTIHLGSMPTRSRATAAAVASSRPHSCLIGIGDYDEPEFLIPMNGIGASAVHSRHSVVVVNEGAREHSMAGEAAQTTTDEAEGYYSSLKDIQIKASPEEGTALNTDMIPEPDGVYYSAINLKEQPATGASGAAARASRGGTGEGCNLHRSHYFALERIGMKQGGIMTEGKTRSISAATGGANDEDEPSMYDYLQLTDTPEVLKTTPAGEASTIGTASTAKTQCPMLYASNSRSLLEEPTPRAPSFAQPEPVQKSAGKTASRIERGPEKEDSVYNTLQRSNRSGAIRRNADDIYNVIIMD